MDQNRIFVSHLMLELSDRFQKRLAFDITDRTADLDNGYAHVRIRKVSVKTALDLVRDMRNDLHCATAIITTTFLLQNSPVYLSCCYIGVLVKTLVDETLIMT